MKLHILNEDKRPPKLPVVVSPEIIEKMDRIADYNKDKKEKISEWYEGIDGFKDYISNPVIAWDYTDKFTHISDGETIIKELGFEASYTIKTNKNKGENYVFVFKLTLKPDEFGLDVPSSLKENVQNNKRYQIKQTISSNNDYGKILMERYRSYLNYIFR